MTIKTICILAMVMAVTCLEDDHHDDHHDDEPWPRNGVERWEYEGAFTASHEEEDEEEEDHGEHEEHEEQHGDTLLLAKGKIVSEIHQGHTEEELTWADSEMAILIMPIASANHNGVEAVEDEAGELWEHALEAGGTAISLTYPMTNGASLLPRVVYKLEFDDHAFLTTWPINMNTSYAIFAQHGLAEFRMPGTGE
jgi:hypothetical protein